MRVIFINGHARSGTTWLGKMLSLCDGVHYLFEPFSSNFKPFTGINAQDIVKRIRWTNLDKGRKFDWDFLDNQFFIRNGKNQYCEAYKDILRDHINKFINNVSADTLIIKQPRIEAHGLFCSVFSDCEFTSLFLDRCNYGVIDSHSSGMYWDWVYEDWALYENSLKNDSSIFLLKGRRPWALLNELVNQRRDFLEHMVREDMDAFSITYEEICRDQEVIFNLIDQMGLILKNDARTEILRFYSVSNRGDGHMMELKRVPNEQAFRWRSNLPRQILRDFNFPEGASGLNWIESIKWDIRFQLYCYKRSRRGMV